MRRRNKFFGHRGSQSLGEYGIKLCGFLFFLSGSLWNYLVHLINKGNCFKIGLLVMKPKSERCCLLNTNSGVNVVKTKPCPFLGSDNYCSIYEVRPSDCVRFPYMDNDFMLKRQPLALKNSTFCPITYYVLEKLIEEKK